MKIHLALILGIILSTACSKESQPPSADRLELNLQRVITNSFDTVKVTASVTRSGAGLSGKTLQVSASKGLVSTVGDKGNGQYEFILQPDATGVYRIEVNVDGLSVVRDALVFDEIAAELGQPMAVPGDYVNSEGYEDGVTISPDGEYLFVQYGPVYFSGIIHVASICSDPSYSLHNINDCAGRDNSDWIFKTIGPYNDSKRPGFPSARITAGDLSHLSNIVVPGVANGVFVPPTVFYGFKRQSDGSFAEPFKLAFDDANRGVQSLYGLSFHLLGNNMANFTVSWNDYFNNQGDDDADLYSGTASLGQDVSFGQVTYSGDFIASTAPDIALVNLADHTGVQGNSHIYADTSEVVQSLWVDDEVSSHDLAVYIRTSGTFPNGSWQKLVLPASINTTAEESQPFFTGSRLYLRRADAIVYHDYLGSGGADYDQDAAWGNAVTVLRSNISTTTGETVVVGEPTLASYQGKTYLYFVYGINRGTGLNGLIDINMDAGFVELP